MNDNSISILERYLGSARKTGAELVFLCPFCEKKGFRGVKRKLHVNMNTDNYNCFRCETRGLNLGSLMYAVTGNKDYKEENDIGFRNFVYNQVQDKLHKPEEQYDLWGVEAEIEEEMVPVTGATSSVAERVRSYLYNRGFTDKDISKYNIHYGYVDKYKDMVIFPVYLNNVLVFYSGRSVVTSEKAHPSNLSSPTGKSGCLFNYDVAKKKDSIVLVEGIFDAHSCGENAVAMFGKSLSDRQFDLLVQTDASEIKICLDPDALDSAEKIASRLAPYKKTKIVLLSDGDANENHGKMEKTLEEDAMEFNLKTRVKMKLLKSKLRK